MSCCRPHEPAAFFGKRFARRSAKRYRAKGLDADARELVEHLSAGGLAGKSVLDVGGGVGEVQLELLKAGAAHGTVLELVPDYEPVARELARELGLAERSDFRLVDLLREPDAAPEADLVSLHRVVCCSPEGPRLLAIAAGAAREALALSYPRDAWWTRAFVRVQNAALRLVRKQFQTYVHRPADLAAAAESAGLTPSHRRTGRVWEVAAFRRT